jgi:radical SAM protein with 4Fe4S-binding SPASM domain
MASKLDRMRPLFGGTEGLKNYIGVLSGPVAIDWEITLGCNLRCIHCCFAAGIPRSDELTTEEAKGLIDELSKEGVFRISFTGGEPLIRKDFLEIAEYACDTGIELALNTNATLIDKKKAKKISKLFFEVQISLDGATATTHDYIRGVGVFEKTLRGIKELRDAGETIITINTTVMKPNLREIVDILYLAIQLGVDVYRVIPVRALGRAVSNHLGLNIQELIQVYETLAKIKEDVKDKVEIQLPSVPQLLPECAESGFSCVATITKCAITPEGFVKPCDAFDIFIGGNVRRQTLREIWLESIQFKVFRQSLYEISPLECKRCPFSKQCRGGCKGLAFMTYGTLDMPDPLCIAIQTYKALTKA